MANAQNSLLFMPSNLVPFSVKTAIDGSSAFLIARLSPLLSITSEIPNNSYSRSTCKIVPYFLKTASILMYTVREKSNLLRVDINVLKTLVSISFLFQRNSNTSPHCSSGIWLISKAKFSKYLVSTSASLNASPRETNPEFKYSFSSKISSSVIISWTGFLSW